MIAQYKYHKSPFMSQSSYLNRDGEKEQIAATCSQCLLFQQEIEEQNSILHQLTYQDNTDLKQQEQVLSNRLLKRRIQELEINELRIKKRISDLQMELTQTEQKAHEQTMTKGHYLQQNIELKDHILRLEHKNLEIQSDPDINFPNQQKLVRELDERIEKLNQNVYLQTSSSQDQKFIQSVLHMVVSCHPQDHFKVQPSLKQTWSWLKVVLQEYVQLKKLHTSLQVSEKKSLKSSEG